MLAAPSGLGWRGTTDSHGRSRALRGANRLYGAGTKMRRWDDVPGLLGKVPSIQYSILPVQALMAKLTVNDLNVRGKRVFVRVDYNVPLEEKDGQMVITDATRIVETLPTLNLLVERGGKLILAAHLGRPKGRREPSLSLRPVAAKLADLLGRPVAFVDDCIGEKVEKTAGVMQPGDALLLENVRYYKEEEANDLGFADKLAKT